MKQTHEKFLLSDTEQDARELSPNELDAMAGGAVDYYLKLDGVPGESSDKPPPSTRK